MILYRVSLKYEITKAQLLIKTIPPEIKVKTERNGYEMDGHPIKIQMDNKDFFESIGIKSVDKVLKESAEYGKQAVLKSMARCTKENDALLGPDGMTMAEVVAQSSYKTISSTLDFIPENRPKISWKDGYTDIKYIKDDRNVEWKPPEIEFEYVPYSVDIKAERYIEEVSPPMPEKD